MAKRAPLKQAATALRKHSLGYPDTIEDFPWGHSAFKVKGKVFLFTYLCEEEGFLSLSMKLPLSIQTPVRTSVTPCVSMAAKSCSVPWTNPTGFTPIPTAKPPREPSSSPPIS